MRLRPLLTVSALLTIGAAAPAPPIPAAQESRTQVAYRTSTVPAHISRSRPLYIGWPKDLTPLPEQFLPLRTERDGALVVAISTSDRLKTRPNWLRLYWVHVSKDGGKHWQGYFTGLVFAEPFIFFSTSQLPMLAGKTLDLEGEKLAPDGVSMRDIPASRRTPVVVHIPLEAIMADRDGDGITDLLAQYLGLDGSPDAPFILGSTPAADCGQVSEEQRLLAAAIEEISWKWHRDWSDPLLLVGDPARFACVRSDRKALVYRPGSEDADRLSPEYIPVFTLNETRDRAEGEGWHAELVDGAWKVTRPPAPMI